jgi:SNF2 family DNA or RNA helicase
MSSLHLRKQSKSSKKLWLMLDDYQQDAVEFAVRAKTAALFFEQGTGKTWIATAVAQRLIDQGEQLSALFVVPLSNIDTTWKKTLSAMLPNASVCRSVDEFQAARGHRILLLHYEALPPLVKKLRKLPWTLITYDESQRLKNRNTLQSRIASKLRDAAPYKLILSGTPIEAAPQDVWAQLRFLRPQLFGVRWKEFEDEYLEPLTATLDGLKRGTMAFERAFKRMMIEKSKRAFNQDMMPAFLETIKPYALRVTKDVLKLPPLTFIDEHVQLRGNQRALYDELERELIAEIGQQSYVTAPLKITKIAKLHQVCGGYVFDDDGECHEVGRAKLRRLKAIVKAEQRPLVVFCRYLQEVDAIKEALVAQGLSVGTITGRVKREDRTRIINKFQSLKLDAIVAQVRTGGVGIDLFAASVGIFYSMTYSFIDFEQAVARLHRRGQKKPVRIYVLIAQNTIDEDICSALRSKRKVSEVVLTKLKGDRYGRRKAHVQVHRRRPRQGTRHPAGVRSRRAA